MSHRSVLLEESLEGLHLKIGDMLLNGTLGGGGIEREVLKHYGEGIVVLSLDADEGAIEKAREEFPARKNLHFFHENFRNLDVVLENYFGTKEEVLDGASFDLGLSSDQLEHSGRGFSFQKEEPLRMTLSAHPSLDDLTAEKIVNEWSEEEIANVLYELGEEKKSRRIAKAIVEARRNKRITTTKELAEVVEKASPRRGKIHPATKTFQALRIAVNGELTALKSALEHSLLGLRKGRRVAVISFHSLEDRIVKKFFKEKALENELAIITKKPIVPTRAEMKDNPRSRSAKLRIAEKI